MPWWRRDVGGSATAEMQPDWFRPAAGVSAASRDGRTVLLDLGSEKYFGLDEVGSDIWMHLAEDRSVPEIAHCLSIEYAAPVEYLEVDVRRFLADMRRRGLVVPAAHHA